MGISSGNSGAAKKTESESELPGSDTHSRPSLPWPLVWEAAARA
ncbi:MAG: hypothetical protein VW991_01580 [Aquiluna sp.]